MILDEVGVARAWYRSALRPAPWSWRPAEPPRFLPLDDAARAMELEPDAVLRLAAAGYLRARAASPIIGHHPGAAVEVEPALLTGRGVAALAAREARSGPPGVQDAPNDPEEPAGVPAATQRPERPRARRRRIGDGQ